MDENHMISNRRIGSIKAVQDSLINQEHNLSTLMSFRVWFLGTQSFNDCPKGHMPPLGLPQCAAARTGALENPFAAIDLSEI